MDVNNSAKSGSYGAACVDFGLRQVEGKKWENLSLSLSLTHTQADIISLLWWNSGVGLLHKSTQYYHRHTLARFLWLILSLDKYSQSVSQLYINICEIQKQNTHVQHSYTHRTVNILDQMHCLHKKSYIYASLAVHKVLYTAHKQQVNVK